MAVNDSRDPNRLDVFDCEEEVAALEEAVACEEDAADEVGCVESDEQPVVVRRQVARNGTRRAARKFVAQSDDTQSIPRFSIVMRLPPVLESFEGEGGFLWAWHFK